MLPDLVRASSDSARRIEALFCASVSRRADVSLVITSLDGGDRFALGEPWRRIWSGVLWIRLVGMMARVDQR